MALQRTFSMVKPNATLANNIGAIYQRFEEAGLSIVASRMTWLSQKEAEGFYEEHKGRPFFEPLVAFMTSGPVMLQVLEGEDAIAKNREIMGPTNPEDAAPNTIRADFAKSMRENAVHGSDSVESANREIAYFFGESNIYSR